MNGVLDVTSTGNDDYFTENDSTTGAYFRMDNGAILEMKGTSSENHRLRINSQKRNWVEFEGTNPNSKTTTSASLCAKKLPIIASIEAPCLSSFRSRFTNLYFNFESISLEIRRSLV